VELFAFNGYYFTLFKKKKVSKIKKDFGIIIFCLYYVFTRTPFFLYFCPETKVPKVLRSKGEMARANGDKLPTVKF